MPWVANQPSTVHDLLLQKNDGTFDLVIWGEKVKNSTMVGIEFHEDIVLDGPLKLFDPTIGTKPQPS